jgi:hypothetical protein
MTPPAESKVSGVSHRERRFLTFVVGLGIGAAIIIVLGGRYLGKWDCAGCEGKELAKAISDARTVLVQLLLAAGAGGTLYFTWRNYVRSIDEANEGRARANETQALARESRTSENFVKAVEQLGNTDSMAVRVGGIFGLGRLLRTATPEGDYWPLMDVLTSFIRGSFPAKEEGPRQIDPPEDLQAACNVLARRSSTTIYKRYDDSPLDLHSTDLSGTWLAGGHFEDAFLENSFLITADLRKAFLTGANLTGAKLEDAELAGADLAGVIGLDPEQLNKAKGDDSTVLPDGYSRPSSWSQH